MPLASVRGLSWELPPEQWHLHLLGTRFQPEFALGSAYPDFIVFCQFCSPLPPPLLEIQNDWVCLLPIYYWMGFVLPHQKMLLLF